VGRIRGQERGYDCDDGGTMDGMFLCLLGTGIIGIALIVDWRDVFGCLNLEFAYAV
jgi:hypothetical protein